MTREAAYFMQAATVQQGSELVQVKLCGVQEPLNA